MRTHGTCSLALAAALALFACQSPDKGQTTGASITKNAGLIERGMHELDAVVASLHELVDTPAADLAGQRKAFEKALADVETTSTQVSETAAKMSASGQAYFRDWDAQLATIQNEDIRARSAERKQAIEASFTDLQGEYGEAKSAFEPLLSNLRDIRAALRSDLTLEGLDALKPAVKQVDKQTATVREKLQDLSADFRALGVGMSQTGPPPANPSH
jgi:chromosome segregation ATPase